MKKFMLMFFIATIPAAFAAGSPASEPASASGKSPTTNAGASRAGQGKPTSKAGPDKTTSRPSKDKGGATKEGQSDGESGSEKPSKDRDDEGAEQGDESEGEGEGEKDPFSHLHQAKKAVDAMRGFAPPPARLGPILEDAKAVKELMGPPPTPSARRESWIKPSGPPDEGSIGSSETAPLLDPSPTIDGTKPANSTRLAPLAEATDRLRKHARKAPILRYPRTRPPAPTPGSRPD